jgi:hypothetical protein
MDELEKAIKLIEDKNLVWSEDFDSIRLELTQLMRKAADVEYHKLEAELDALAKSVNNEGSNNARRTRTTKKDSSVQS